jgi:hypothetical protein
MAKDDKKPERSEAMDFNLRVRAIRRLARPFPRHTQGERLKRIEDLASGKTDPEERRSFVSKDLAKRLTEGAASRSPRMNITSRLLNEEEEKIKSDGEKAARKKEADAKARTKKGGLKRKEGPGRDRQEGPDMNRTTDFLR